MPKGDFNKVACKLRRGCSPVNFLHIFRTPFPRNTSGRLLLNFFRENDVPDSLAKGKDVSGTFSNIFDGAFLQE